MKFLTIIVLLFLLISCAGDIKNSGSTIYEENIFALENRPSNKEDAIKLLGPPSYRSQYNNDIWYYISETTSQFAFFKKRLRKRNIYVLEFKDNNLINIKHLTKEDANKVAFEEKRTRFVGNKRTLLEKVFTGTQYGL